MTTPVVITVAVIPARGGSRRLPRKNIKLLHGKPLIAYAIEAARQSSSVHKVIVSTEDSEIADVARTYGAEVPFIRPAELASDTATSVAVLQHAVETFEKQLGITIDPILLIQPTSPFVQAEDIESALSTLKATQSNSCVSVCAISERPEWMVQLDGSHVRPFLPTAQTDARTQDLPPLYRLNGAVYALRRQTLIKDGLIVDYKNLSAIVMSRERSIDIDELIDFQFAETILTTQGNTL